MLKRLIVNSMSSLGGKGTTKLTASTPIDIVNKNEKTQPYNFNSLFILTNSLVL